MCVRRRNAAHTQEIGRHADLVLAGEDEHRAVRNGDHWLRHPIAGDWRAPADARPRRVRSRAARRRSRHPPGISTSDRYGLGRFEIHTPSAACSHGSSVPSSSSSNRCSVRGASSSTRIARLQISTRSTIRRACRTREMTITARVGSENKKSSSCQEQHLWVAQAFTNSRVRHPAPAERDDVLGLLAIRQQAAEQGEREVFVEQNPHDAWRTAGGRCAAT